MWLLPRSMLNTAFSEKRHRLVHGVVLQCQKHRHDLGDAGWILGGVNVLGIEDRAGLCLHDNGGLCADLGPLGPAVDLVGLHRDLRNLRLDVRAVFPVLLGGIPPAVL